MPPPSTIQWLSLVGIIWLQAISGTNTAFPAYSSQLKQLLSISQVQLNNLAVASDAGKLFGFFSGIAANYLPFWLVLLIGSTLGMIGYGVQFLFVINKIPSLSYLQFFFLTILAGNSICWINTVCYVMITRNFPSHRQVALGLSTSYANLTAKIFTIMVDWIFSSSSMKKAQGYLLLNTVVPLGVSMLTAPLVREVQVEKEKHIHGGFIIMFFITIATGIYAVFASLETISDGLPWIHVVVMGFLLAAPVVIPLFNWVRAVLQGKCWWWTNSLREKRIHDLSVNEVEVGVADRTEIEIKEAQGVELGEEEEEEEEQDVGIIRAKEEIGVKLMVQRVDFWLYFFVYMFGATLGLVYMNNLGQVAESHGHADTTSLVSLASSFGFFGRLVPSLWDYFFSKSRHMVSGVASILTLMVPMAGAFFLLLNASQLSLYISTAIIGVCTGAISSIAVSMTAELFGTKNFSVNHNVVIVNIPIGSFLFGYMAAILYQRAGFEGQETCIGFGCYRKTFIIWGSICSLGTLLAFILYLRTRKFYLQGEAYKTKAKKLEEEVKHRLDDEAMGQLGLLEVIDDIQRPRLGYHFEEYNKRTVDTIVCMGDIETGTKESLHATALRFRLLRQHGYEVNEGMFNPLKDEAGNFKASYLKDAKGLLSLYEASHLVVEGESILEEAKHSTRTALMEINGNIEPNLATMELDFSIVNSLID